MLKEKVSNTKHRPVITIVPRRLSAIRQKINPLSTDKQYGLADSKNDIQSTTIPTILSARKLTKTDGKHNSIDTIMFVLQHQMRPMSLETWKIRNNRTVILKDCSIITIFLPVYFLVIRRPTSFTNITISSCYATTCLGQETPYRTRMITVLYPIDGNANDISGYASGIALGSNSPSYTGYSYFGYQAITLFSFLQQYVMIPSVNLSEKSFTIETWIMSTSAAVTGDYGIFGQCDLSLNCLLISVRDSRFVVSFNSTKTNSNTLTGTTFITPNIWFHLTIAYDALLYQQQTYVNVFWMRFPFVKYFLIKEL
ncbi:hypothetical protein I4U23_008893 [Adineta vaga]|nr:hypothetical protein I4U23_008893 [Adineta vaga]